MPTSKATRQSCLLLESCFMLGSTVDLLKVYDELKRREDPEQLRLYMQASREMREEKRAALS